MSCGIVPHWLYLPDEDPSGSKRCKTDEVDVDDVGVLEGCLTTFVKSLADPHSLRLEGPVVLGTRLTPHSLTSLDMNTRVSSGIRWLSSYTKREFRGQTCTHTILNARQICIYINN